MELRKEFEFEGFPCRDAVYGIDINLCGAGRFVCASNDNIADISELEDKLTSDFLETLQATIEVLGENGISYLQLPYRPEDVTTMMSMMLNEIWKEYGTELKHLSFTALYPDDDSVTKLIEAKKNPPKPNASAESFAAQTAPASQSTAPKRFCTNCGADMGGKGTIKFCTKCGAKLNW